MYTYAYVRLQWSIEPTKYRDEYNIGTNKQKPLIKMVYE